MPTFLYEFFNRIIQPLKPVAGDEAIQHQIAMTLVKAKLLLT